MNAVIIYEEGDCAARASALLKRASDRADVATQWTVKPWQLEMLDLAPLAQEALREAADAHLIVLAVSGRESASPRLMIWLEWWAACRQVQDAALGVFDGHSGDVLSATAAPELLEFAARHGLSFILGEVHPAQAESLRLWGDPREREGAQTMAIAHILEETTPGNYQHWGINE